MKISAILTAFFFVIATFFSNEGFADNDQRLLLNFRQDNVVSLSIPDALDALADINDEFGLTGTPDEITIIPVPGLYSYSDIDILDLKTKEKVGTVTSILNVNVLAAVTLDITFPPPGMTVGPFPGLFTSTVYSVIRMDRGPYNKKAILMRSTNNESFARLSTLSYQGINATSNDSFTSQLLATSGFRGGRVPIDAEDRQNCLADFSQLFIDGSFDVDCIVILDVYHSGGN